MASFLLTTSNKKHKTIKQLTPDFYLRDDVVLIAKELLGKVLVTEFDGIRTAGMITETEAYRGPEDKASHAYNNRRTTRTEIMYWKGGTAYVYLCYGIHHLFNVVTGVKDTPHAVLIRAVEPVENTAAMLVRRKYSRIKPQLTAGPGVLTKALGINTNHTGMDLTAEDSPIRIEDRGVIVSPEAINAGPRIGIDYAGEWVSKPWRFYLKDSNWVSRKK